MTRRSVKFPSALRRGPWKTTLLRREVEHRNVSRSIYINASCAERWSNLKFKFRFRSDSELVDYLLALGESQPKPRLSDDESDEGWCTSDQTERKKRGPSLRAVLRRSKRKSCSKSGFISQSIDTNNFPSEDSNQSDEECSRSESFTCSNSNIKSHKHGGELPSCDQQSVTKKSLNSSTHNCMKDSQTSPKLCVESIDIQLPEQVENEPYEFKEDLPSDGNLSFSPVLVQNSNNNSKECHRRWKSYHKDKRKWKQSYAAVSSTESHTKIKMKDEPSGHKSEQEKKIFKTLKKKRILTAYLDSQNTIAASIIKDLGCMQVVGGEGLNKELNVKSDAELVLPNIKWVANVNDAIDDQSGKSKEDVSEAQTLDEVESFVGKENQNESSTVVEISNAEVNEKLKIKRKKKKALQDIDESSLKQAGQSTEGDPSVLDKERHHRKTKRNWKKSIISYELEENASGFVGERTDFDEGKDFTCNPISSRQILNSSNAFTPSGKSELGEKIDKVDLKDKNYSMVQLTETIEQDNSLAQTKQCALCHHSHSQQTCPIEHPLQIVEDSMTFEQWQLQSQVQIRCSVIEAPRSRAGRMKKITPGSPSACDKDKRSRDTPNTRTDENTCIFAEESLPPRLTLKIIEEKHGKSVLAQSFIPQFTQFGPLVGPCIHEKDISDESDMRHIWEIWDGRQASYLSTLDPQKSNWLRFLRPAPERDQHNVTVTVRDKQIFFVSVVDVSKDNELLYWADDHVTSWSKKKILKSSCGGCNMQFAHPLYYRTHCAIFHDPLHSLTIRKYHCKVCGESVMGKENIMKHAADLHEGRGAYQCQYCHKFFLRLNYLEMHRTYGCSSNPHRTRPLCDFCGRYFCQPQKLKVHIKRMHSDMNEVLREFQCKSCLKILGSRAALQRHFKEVHHRDVIVSNCERCGKSFQNRSNLKIHMLTHSGVKPFRCQQEGCSAAFTTKQCLQFHYKKAHGLSEDALPRIERSIAYTFDAYAGETIDGGCKVKEVLKRPPKLLRKSRRSLSKARKSQSHYVPEKFLADISKPFGTVPSETELSESVSCATSAEVNLSMKAQQYSTVADPISTLGASPQGKFVEMATVYENTLSPSSVVCHIPNGDDTGPVCSKVLTPLRTVALHHGNESYPPPSHGGRVVSCTSPRQSLQSHLGTSPTQDLRSMISLENKGHKKWLGEVIEVAEEVAAAAMCLSPHLSPHLKRDIYEFDENKAKSKQYLDSSGRQDLSVDVNVGRSKASTALAPFHHPESASLLVEAALDAAERDICCPHLTDKSSPNPVRHSPDSIQLPPSSYILRPAEEDGLLSTPYFSPQPSSGGTADNHYLLSHSPSSHPHIQNVESYVSHINPPRLYCVPNHQVQQHQLLPQGPHSSDDEGLDSDFSSRAECAQNLSMNVKEKMQERTNTSVMYSAPPLHADFNVHSPSYQENIALPQQNDVSFSGAVLVSSPRYRLYDLCSNRERLDAGGTDLPLLNRGQPQVYSTYDETGGSMDLSVPRDHGPDHSSPSEYNTGLTHQFASSHCVPNYSTHPTIYENLPLQRSRISSSSNSPSASPSPGPAHYHSYTSYY